MPENAAPRASYPSLTTRQVAERLGCSQDTIWRLLRLGKAPASYVIGGRRLWKETDVLDWIEQHRQEPAA